MGCAWRCGGEQALSRHAASTASSPLPRGRTCAEARRRADRRVLVACARGAAALVEGERERARRTHPACFFFPSLSLLFLSPTSHNAPIALPLKSEYMVPASGRGERGGWAACLPRVEEESANARVVAVWKGTRARRQ